MSETTTTGTTGTTGTTSEPETAAALRAWAAGVYATEAAVELLIRAQGGRYAQPGCPWVRTEDDGTVWVDVDELVDGTGTMSGGERRLVLIVASLLDETGTVSLSEVAGLDRATVDLVLAAIAHAAGTHEQQDTIEVVDDVPQLVSTDRGSRHPWPTR